jgi:hypothetical protein
MHFIELPAVNPAQVDTIDVMERGLKGAQVTPDSLAAVKAAAPLPHPPRAMAAAIGGWKVERRGNVNFTATTSYSISISIIRATVDVIAKAAANTHRQHCSTIRSLPSKSHHRINPINPINPPKSTTRNSGAIGP